MRLHKKIRLYHENSNYVAVIFDTDFYLSGVGTSAAEALIKLGQSMSSLPYASDLISEPTADTAGGPSSTTPPREEESPQAVIGLVKTILRERFGDIPLRALAKALGLEDVSPQVLSASIHGKGARRVRVRIARILGVDSTVLWPPPH